MEGSLKVELHPIYTQLQPSNLWQSLTATQLGSSAIQAAVEKAKVSPAQVEEVYMGCVIQVSYSPRLLLVVIKALIGTIVFSPCTLKIRETTFMLYFGT